MYFDGMPVIKSPRSANTQGPKSSRNHVISGVVDDFLRRDACKQLSSVRTDETSVVGLNSLVIEADSADAIPF